MSLLIKTAVDIPSGQVIGFNEDLCLHLEKFGNATVISVEEYIPEISEKEHIPEQMTLADSMKYTELVTKYEKLKRECAEMIKTFRDTCEHCGFNYNDDECFDFRDEDGERCVIFKWRKYWVK